MRKCGDATSEPKGRPEWLHHYGGWSHLGRALGRGSSAHVEEPAHQACVGRHVHALKGGHYPLSQREPRCVSPHGFCQRAVPRSCRRRTSCPPLASLVAYPGISPVSLYEVFLQVVVATPSSKRYGVQGHGSPAPQCRLGTAP